MKNNLTTELDLDKKEAKRQQLIEQLTKSLYGNKKYNFEVMSELMFDHMSQGKSYQSLAPLLGVSRKTIYNWETKHPEWAAAKVIAQELRLLWVENNLIGLAQGDIKGQAAAAIFYAKNACPDEFKDKREVVASGGVTYMIDTGIAAKPEPTLVENIVAEIGSEEDDDIITEAIYPLEPEDLL